MNKLAALVLKHKAAKHGIPEGQGWMTRTEAARQLGVPERNVHDMLRDAIAAKDVVVGKFSIWDAAGMRPTPVTCYRIAGEKASTPAPAKAPKADSELEESIIRAAERRPELPPSEIIKRLPKRLRTLANVALVKKILGL
jgi:hypothetical protein